MDLFHYTRRGAVDSILAEGIRMSRRPHPTTVSMAVSLTSSSSPDGHGLTKGERITGERLMMLVRKRPELAGNAFVDFADLREVRLTVRVPEGDPKLVSWREFCRRESIPGQWREAAELSGQFSPAVSVFTDDEFGRVAREVRRGLRVLQGRTWWFYEDRVPPEWIVKTEGRVAQTGRYEARS